MINCILYGAGSDLNKILPMLKNEGFNPLCIADGSPNKIGQHLFGISVVAPEDIVKYNSKTIIITASFFDSIYEKINTILGDKTTDYKILVSPYAWLMLVNVDFNIELLSKASNYIQAKKTEILNMYDSNDKKTNEIIDYLLKTRTDNAYRFCSYNEIRGMQYIEGYFYENELQNIGPFTFIDVGAYIGDTYKLMKSMYKSNMVRYYAYEPSASNYKRLLDDISSLSNDNCNIEFKNYALGNTTGEINMGKAGGEFGVVNDSTCNSYEKIRIMKMDDDVIDVVGKLVIKMDVEGAEMDVLRGGVNTIKKYRPIMAICVYHKYQDIYELPKFLINNGLKYRFILKSGIHTHLIAFPIN